MSPASSYRRHLATAAGLLALAGCGPSVRDGFTPSEWKTVESLSPLPALPADPTNQYADSEAAARLGQIIFFDKRYAGPLAVGNDGTNGGLGNVGDLGKVACSDCHDPKAGFSDNRSYPNNLSLGAHWGKRNSPSITNVGYYTWFTWAGRLDSLWAQGASALESPDMASNRCRVAHYVWDDLKAPYEALFTGTPLPTALDPSAPDASRFPSDCKPKMPGAPDGAWEAMTPEDQHAILQISANVGKAIAAYERKVVSGPAPFDRFVAGDRNAISDSAKRGLKLFIGRGFCVECHSGPTFSDEQFHDLGVPQSGDRVPPADDGRYTDLPLALKNPYSMTSQFSDDPAFGHQREDGMTVTQADHGAFRTKDLRGVAETAPYFHDGSEHTLSDVIWFYNQGGGDAVDGMKDPKMRPLNLTTEEQADLVEFLRSLTGTVSADWGAPGPGAGAQILRTPPATDGSPAAGTW